MCVGMLVFMRMIDGVFCVFFLMIRRPPRSTQSSSSAASDVYKRQLRQAYEDFHAGKLGVVPPNHPLAPSDEVAEGTDSALD